MRALAPVSLAAIVLIAAPAAANPDTANTAEVHLLNASNESVGQATLRDTPNGVLVELDLKNLPPGQHAFHIHEHGQCKPPFETAGGHMNPSGRHHGFEAATGPHAGDLPNLIVPESGTVRAELLARDVRLGDGTKGLMDTDGSAFVIHEKADDHRTDPAGDAGGRIACGVVERGDPN